MHCTIAVLSGHPLGKDRASFPERLVLGHMSFLLPLLWPWFGFEGIDVDRCARLNCSGVSGNSHGSCPAGLREVLAAKSTWLPLGSGPSNSWMVDPLACILVVETHRSEW